jgi:acid-sensing ion channel 1
METKSKNTVVRVPEEAGSYLREFCGSTTVHGVTYLTAEKHLLRRLIWFVALGVAVGYCANHFYKTFDAYFKIPFSTTLTRRRVSEMTFPAVTLCNLNVINVNRCVATMLNSHLKQNGKSAFQSESHKMEKEKEFRKRLKLIVKVISSKRMTNDEMKGLRKEFEYNFDMTERGLQMEETLRSFAHTKEEMLSLDFLLPCTWRGKDCSSNNFTSFLNLLMGQCFTFNSGKQGHALLKTSLSGPSNGLRLKLNVGDVGHVTNYYSVAAGF